MARVIKDRQTFDECGCSYCTLEEISTPDTGGEYDGIDVHMATMEARLAKAAALMLESAEAIEGEYSAGIRDRERNDPGSLISRLRTAAG